MPDENNEILAHDDAPSPAKLDEQTTEAVVIEEAEDTAEQPDTLDEAEEAAETDDEVEEAKADENDDDDDSGESDKDK